ncbi:hypothetical protein EY04_24050 [Pseudomonas chlororaphis]|nr:hypothetical protein EY04_24050 [Pseudomonas chlororaphis]
MFSGEIVNPGQQIHERWVDVVKFGHVSGRGRFLLWISPVIRGGDSKGCKAFKVSLRGCLKLFGRGGFRTFISIHGSCCPIDINDGRRYIWFNAFGIFTCSEFFKQSHQ